MDLPLQFLALGKNKPDTAGRAVFKGAETKPVFQLDTFKTDPLLNRAQTWSHTLPSFPKETKAKVSEKPQSPDKVPVNPWYQDVWKNPYVQGGIAFVGAAVLGRKAIRMNGGFSKAVAHSQPTTAHFVMQSKGRTPPAFKNPVITRPGSGMRNMKIRDVSFQEGYHEGLHALAASYLNPKFKTGNITRQQFETFTLPMSDPFTRLVGFSAPLGTRRFQHSLRGMMPGESSDYLSQLTSDADFCNILDTLDHFYPGSKSSVLHNRKFLQNTSPNNYLYIYENTVDRLGREYPLFGKLQTLLQDMERHHEPGLTRLAEHYEVIMTRSPEAAAIPYTQIKQFLGPVDPVLVQRTNTLRDEFAALARGNF